MTDFQKMINDYREYMGYERLGEDDVNWKKLWWLNAIGGLIGIVIGIALFPLMIVWFLLTGGGGDKHDRNGGRKR